MKPALFPLSRPDIQSVRVLLVDDSTHVRNELRQLLELSGWVQVVGEAADGLEAVQLAAELCPDVIIMDLEMPKMDGCEATRRIKGGAAGASVIILSVHATPQAQERAREAGADYFITKGERVENLLAAILAAKGINQTNQDRKGENHE